MLFPIAFHLSHDAQDLRWDRRLVAHCRHGSEVSQKAALAIRKTGVRPAQLERGIPASSTTPFTPGSPHQAEKPKLRASAMTKSTA